MSNRVTVNEVLSCVNIVAFSLPGAVCPSAAKDVNDLIAAVDAALNGCGCDVRASVGCQFLGHGRFGFGEQVATAVVGAERITIRPVAGYPAGVTCFTDPPYRSGHYRGDIGVSPVTGDLLSFHEGTIELSPSGRRLSINLSSTPTFGFDGFSGEFVVE